jgi:hypothetical protein
MPGPVFCAGSTNGPRAIIRGHAEHPQPAARARARSRWRCSACSGPPRVLPLLRAGAAWWTDEPMTGVDFETHIAQVWRVIEGLDGWGRSLGLRRPPARRLPAGVIFDADNKGWELWTWACAGSGPRRASPSTCSSSLAHWLVLVVLRVGAAVRAGPLGGAGGRRHGVAAVVLRLVRALVLVGRHGRLRLRQLPVPAAAGAVLALAAGPQAVAGGRRGGRAGAGAPGPPVLLLHPGRADAGAVREAGAHARVARAHDGVGDRGGDAGGQRVVARRRCGTGTTSSTRGSSGRRGRSFLGGPVRAGARHGDVGADRHAHRVSLPGLRDMSRRPGAVAPRP